MRPFSGAVVCALVCATPLSAAVPEFPEATPGGFLESVEAEARVVSQLIQMEVENALKESRIKMATHPAAIKEGLKLMLDRVQRVPELNAQVRAELRGKLEAALQIAARLEFEFAESNARAQERLMAAKERALIVSRLEGEQGRIRQLIDRFDSLLLEQRYELAQEIGDHEVNRLAPGSTIAASSLHYGRELQYYQKNVATRKARSQAVVATLYQVDLAATPQPDDQPIVYPEASIWEELTMRRQKYAVVDLKEQGKAERRIHKALDDTTTLEFVATPLQDVVDYLKDLHQIEIQIDSKALEDAGQATDTPVDRNLKGVSLRSALKLMLGSMDLTYVVKNEVLMITTPEKAGAELVTKVYPVADLVIPIQSTGFSGGFGGLGGSSGGMGGMGGGGGGMGGGGMGGGGMGGGGMGGGGGGGFFNVIDVPGRH